MTLRVSSGTLSAMTPLEREDAFGALLAEARNPSRATLASLDARIRAFEIRYEISSDEMRERLRNGAIQETAEIADWLFWLDTRDSRVSA